MLIICPTISSLIPGMITLLFPGNVCLLECFLSIKFNFFILKHHENEKKVLPTYPYFEPPKWEMVHQIGKHTRSG